MFPNLADEVRVDNHLLTLLGVEIPCEMADPVTYALDGKSVESLRPCETAAQWRLVLQWHHLPDTLDNHLLCHRHLGIWHLFKAVEDPPWDIAHLGKL